ncbi:hypothetical protein AEAC466_19390 [Asticcacaulis sp. AC466]|nr:hypothetical protein AEAC466_19390 [Asticcacaulis sp. AC466]
MFDPKLPNVLGLDNFFDLAVCNPPFFRPEWKRDYADILQSARLEDACVTVADVSAEIIFLAQNLRLVRSGGIVAMIMPDGMITGYRAKSLRSAIIANHRIDCVLQLPQNSFHDTDARCFIIFITKEAHQCDKIKLLRYDALDGLLESIFVSKADGEQRLDYDYHSSKIDHGKEVTTLRHLGAEVVRGSVGTVEARDSRYPIFHTSDYLASESGLINLPSAMPMLENKKLVVAQAGDILMARVDRKLHEKVGMVVSGMAAITDCVYRIRLPIDAQEVALKALRSREGAARLKAVSKGVSARLLGKADLLDMPLNL